MGLLDTIEDGLEDGAKAVGRTLAVEGLGALVKWIAKQLPDGDHDDAEAIARGALEGASEAARNRLWLKMGGDQVLQEQLDKISNAAKEIEAAKPWIAKPAGERGIPSLDINLEIVGTLSPESRRKIVASGVDIDHVDSSAELKDYFGTVLGHTLVAGDADRNVPAAIQEILDGGSK